MKNHIRWLLTQIELWVAEGIIQPWQGDALRRRYAALAEPEKPGAPWAIILFAGFGAVVVGLGVILLFAYNWEKMHRFVKLGIVFGALAAAHGAGLALRRRENLKGFSDALHLLGAMLFGAGIWLVAQIYHMSAHYPNAFFVWAAGALILAWALPSVPQGLLAAILIPVWGCSETFGFHQPQLLAPLLVLAGTGGLAWRLRSPVLLLGSIVSFTVALLATALHGSHIFLLLLSAAVLFTTLGRLTRDHAAFPASGGIFHFAGRILYYPLLFLMTWPDALEDALLRHSHHGCLFWGNASPTEYISAVLLPLVTAAALVVAVRQSIQRADTRSAAFHTRLVVPTTIFLAYAVAWFGLRVATLERSTEDVICLIVAIGANLAFLFHAFAYLRKGCIQASLIHAIAGSVLFGAWVLARYTDLFESLVSRGIAFIVMGAALFTVAILYHRARKRRQTPGADSAPTAPAPAPTPGTTPVPPQNQP